MTGVLQQEDDALRQDKRICLWSPGASARLAPDAAKARTRAPLIESQLVLSQDVASLIEQVAVSCVSAKKLRFPRPIRLLQNACSRRPAQDFSWSPGANVMHTLPFNW